MFETSQLPFERGTTASFGIAAALIEVGTLKNLEGMEYVVRDAGPNSPISSSPTQAPVKIRCVRNLSGIYLLPRRMVTLDPTNNYRSSLGYAQAASGELAFPVDEFLPATGVAPNDLFYVVTGGPSEVMLPATGMDTILVGSLIDILFATSGVTTTAGRVKLTTFPSSYASAADGLAIANRLRNSLTSLTASSTANAILKARVPWFGLV
jgi:hypothetical protein